MPRKEQRRRQRLASRLKPEQMLQAYYKFEITCQKYRRKILPTVFCGVDNGFEQYPNTFMYGIPQEFRKSSAPQKPTNDARTYDTQLQCPST